MDVVELARVSMMNLGVGISGEIQYKILHSVARWGEIADVTRRTDVQPLALSLVDVNKFVEVDQGKA